MTTSAAAAEIVKDWLDEALVADQIEQDEDLVKGERAKALADRPVPTPGAAPLTPSPGVTDETKGR